MPWKHISITRLEMTNFKRFYGDHSLDLRSEPDIDKPIVLIGGENGRGKTSIHEAINYALYEDDDLPGIHTRPNYLRAVSNRLNRRALDEGKNEYGVAIELLASDNGADRHIRIERQWDVNVAKKSANRVNLHIFENGRPMDFIEDNPSAYQDFLRSLLPPRIAPFFFFDGERIQEFADDENHEHRMIEAIEDILHITVYKSLREDLKKYVIDHIEKYEVKTNSADDFYELQGDKERIEAELENKKDRLADIERDENELWRERKQIEDELRRIASPHASQRDELIEERARLNQELSEAKENIQNGFSPLPLLLSGNLRISLRESLLNEQKETVTPQKVEQLQAQLAEIKHLVIEKPMPDPPQNIAMTPEQISFYKERFDEVCRNVFDLTLHEHPIKTEQQELLHDIGEAGRRKILERINEVERIGSLLRDAIDLRERLSNELRDVETKLQSTSDDPHVTELIKRNQGINVQIGVLEEEKRRLEGEIQGLNADYAKRCRQIDERQEQRKATSKAKQTIKLAQKARRVLDEYIKRLAPEKLETLRACYEL